MYSTGTVYKLRNVQLLKTFIFTIIFVNYVRYLIHFSNVSYTHYTCFST